MKTVDEIIADVEKKYGMSFYGNERIALYGFAEMIWESATKAQMRDDELKIGIEDFTELPFPTPEASHE